MTEGWTDMRRVLILAVALALTGCGGGVQIQRVNVPVACVDAADVPARPEPLGPRPADARSALDVALAKLVELMGPKLDGAGGYVGRSSAILTGCSKKTPGV